MSAVPLYSAKMKSTVPDGIRLVTNQATVADLKDMLELFKLGEETATTYDSETEIPISGGVRYTEYKRYYATGLPTGLMCATSGEITGVPTVSNTFQVLVKITSNTTEYDGSTWTHAENGSAYITVPIIVENVPTSATAGTPADKHINLENQSLTTSDVVDIDLTATGTYSATWRVTGLPAGLKLQNNSIVGTPTTAGTSNVTVILNYTTAYNTPQIEETRVVVFTVTVGVPVIKMNLLNLSYDGSTYSYSTETKAGNDYSLQLIASESPTSWSATGLPAGLSLSNAGLITGVPTNPGVYTVEIKATNATGASAPAYFRLNVTETAAPFYLNEAGVDLFFDLQSRELSLEPPKAESVLASGETVINKPEIPRLVIKDGETLLLNIRFTKGSRIIDPTATGIRFGVASRPGAPLLLDSSTFTKTGTGSAARHVMRIAVSSDEFSSLIGTYFDDEAVETVETTPGSTEPEIQALCEIELTTGAGDTLAKMKSNSLAAVILRSIL